MSIYKQMPKNGKIKKESSLNNLTKRKGGEKMSKIDIIRQHWGKKSYTEIAKLADSTPESVRKMGRKDGLPAYRVNSQNTELTPEQEIEKDVRVASLSKGKSRLQSKYDIVVAQKQELEAVVETIKAVSSVSSYTINTKKSGSKKNRATAFAIASDWHYAETVHAEGVNGMNEFNLEIAKTRAEAFFINTVKLVRKEQAGAEIKTLVLAFLGDMINNHLREEAMEMNSLAPVDEAMQVGRVMESGIKYILDNTDLDLVIPCHSGNHGRGTKKVQWSNEAGHSYEYGMYNGVASAFKDNKRVKFIIPRSYHSYLDIGGFVVRFHHGHAMNYNGGVGGIYISVNKAINQWNKIRHADLDVFGHFHQLRYGGNFVCNGSLVGYNEFAVSIKADFENPKQAFFLVDTDKKAYTISAPIFLE